MASSSKRQKEIARRRAERQAQRRIERERQRRRRNLLVSGGVFSLVLLIVLGLTVLRDPIGDIFADDPKPSASPSADGDPEAVACGAQKPPAPQRMKFDKEPPLSIDKKKSYTMTINSSCGVIEATLFDDQAPRTVNTLSFLAGRKYYDGTFCHRMTKGGLTVLQCGDQSGTGAGELGYTIPEENLKGATYKRGTVAMAKTNAPNSTSSQFFLVIQDSELPPDYTVVGRVSEAGLKVLDTILAIGIDDADGDTQFGEDGAPKQRVYVNSLTVTAK